MRERSPAEILDLYETRIVLEGAAARVAAERRTEHDLRLLRWGLEQTLEVPADDADRMVESNRAFHRTVWRATRNESLIDLLERLDLHLARYPGTTLASPGRWAQALEEHGALVQAIDERDADSAEAIARTHFTSAREIRLDLFAREHVALEAAREA